MSIFNWNTLTIPECWNEHRCDCDYCDFNGTNEYHDEELVRLCQMVIDGVDYISNHELVIRKDHAPLPDDYETCSNQNKHQKLIASVLSLTRTGEPVNVKLIRPKLRLDNVVYEHVETTSNNIKLLAIYYLKAHGRRQHIGWVVPQRFEFEDEDAQ